MLRAFLILSALTIIASAQYSPKGFRTIIQSSFPIDAPLQFDPTNDERLVLSIVKPSMDKISKTNDKHRLRIINIDHKLAQENFRQKAKAKTITSESVFENSSNFAAARLTEQNESKQFKSAAKTERFTKQPAIDYGLPKINIKDDTNLFAASPETEHVDQNLMTSRPSKLFVSKTPSVEELLEKGYVLSDVFPLEFTSDDSDFQFPTDNIIRVSPNNERPSGMKFTEYRSDATSTKQNKSESQAALHTKFGSTDRTVDVRPLEVRHKFLPIVNQAEFNLGKQYVSKFLRPAVSYENSRTENEGIVHTASSIKTKSKQGMTGQESTKNEKVENNLPSNDKDKNAFITSLFEDSSAESEGVKSRLSSSGSGKVYQNPSSKNERKTLITTISGTAGSTSHTLSLSSENTSIKDTKIYPNVVNEYSAPSVSKEEMIFASKFSEESMNKPFTSSSTPLNFEKLSNVKSEKIYSPKFGAVATGEEIRSLLAASNSGNIKYAADSESEDLPKTEEFAIYYKTPTSISHSHNHEQPKGYQYSKKPFTFVTIPKSGPEQSHSNFNSPSNSPIESGNIKYDERLHTESKPVDVIKSFEDFLKPEEFAIYYKKPSTQSGENLENFPLLINRYGAPKNNDNSFLGLPSNLVSFQRLTDLKTPLENIPVLLENAPFVYAEYGLPTVNSDTTPIFQTATRDRLITESVKKSGHFEEVPVILEPHSAEHGIKLSTNGEPFKYGIPRNDVLSIINLPNPEPLATEYGVPSVTPPSLSSVASNIDIRRRKIGPINKPFVEYGLPTVEPPTTTHGSPGGNERPGIDIRKLPHSHIVTSKPSLEPINKPFAEYGLPTVKPPSTSQAGIDIRKLPDLHTFVSKPFLEYVTPSVDSNIDIKTPSERLRQMKQIFQKKTYEFGIPVLKVPKTRPLSSYEVPIY